MLIDAVATFHSLICMHMYTHMDGYLLLCTGVPKIVSMSLLRFCSLCSRHFCYQTTDSAGAQLKDDHAICFSCLGNDNFWLDIVPKIISRELQAREELTATFSLSVMLPICHGARHFLLDQLCKPPEESATTTKNRPASLWLKPAIRKLVSAGLEQSSGLKESPTVSKVWIFQPRIMMAYRVHSELWYVLERAMLLLVLRALGFGKTDIVWSTKCQTFPRGWRKQTSILWYSLFRHFNPLFTPL